MRRGYGEYCAIARALDVLGGRWTLLIIRELAGGPRRYSDLLAGIPGIVTSVLNARMRELRDSGLVEQRRLPPPAGSTVYSLSERGREALPVLEALARWGTPMLEAKPRKDARRAYWIAIALAAGAEPDARRSGVVELRSGDDDVAQIVIEGGTARALQGPAEDPDLVVSGTPERLAALGRDGAGVKLEGRAELLKQLAER